MPKRRKPPPSADEVQSWYVDQAPHNSYYGDRHFFACKTVYGIKKLDSEFIDRITNMTCRADAVQIRKDLNANPHLHRKIKENLRLNIRLKLQDLPKETPKQHDTESEDFIPF